MNEGGDAGKSLESPPMHEGADGGDPSSQTKDGDGGGAVDAGAVAQTLRDAGGAMNSSDRDASVEPRDPNSMGRDAGLDSDNRRDAGGLPSSPIDKPSLDAGFERLPADAGEGADPAIPPLERDAGWQGPLVDAGPPEVHGTPQTHPLDAYQTTGDAIALSGISSNASDITWKKETDTFFVVVNGAGQLHEYSTGFGRRLRTVSLTGASTDTEGLTYLGGDRFAVVVEDNELFVFTLADGQTVVNLSQAPVQRYVVTAPPATVNRGFEGVAFVPRAPLPHRFFACQEGGDSATPMRILQLDERATGVTLSYEDDLVVEEPWSATGELGTLVTDLAGLHYDEAASNLLVLSQESRTVVRVAPDSGAILEHRVLSGSPQYEGITLADDDRLVLVSEPNLVEIFQAP